MSIVSLEEFKGFYRTDIVSDNPTLQVCLDAATEGINGMCGREFVAASAAVEDATARSYAPPVCSQTLRIHDCTQIVSVVESGITLTVNSDYVTDPLQTIAWDGETVPFERLKRRFCIWDSDSGVATVTVTALWGWASIPSSIKFACFVGAKDLADSRDTKYGIADISQFGPLRVRENAQVRLLVNRYIRAESAFGIA